MTHASADMHAYYAARAAYYDAVYLKPERQADIAFLAEHLPQRLAGRRVLEVACGTGYWTQHIAPRAATMVATDGTAQPLDFARQRPGVGNVTFRQVDAYGLGDDLGRFDAAFAGLWFSHVPVQARTAFLQGLHARLARACCSLTTTKCSAATSPSPKPTLPATPTSTASCATARSTGC